MPRAAAPKPTGPDGENLTQWAIKIVVKFHEDCENGMHVYSGELKNALSIDGYPLSSLPTLYTQDRVYRGKFGGIVYEVNTSHTSWSTFDLSDGMSGPYTPVR